MISHKQNSSNLWKGIAENAQVIRKGIQTAIGNGKGTLFWDHNWVINQALIDVSVKDFPQELLGATVSEMWDPNTGWKWDVFAEYLPLSILKLIQAHEVVNDDTLSDQFFWKGESKGEFTIKSAISIIRNSDNAQEEPQWRILWTNPAPNRMKFFLWLGIRPNQNLGPFSFPLSIGGCGSGATILSLGGKTLPKTRLMDVRLDNNACVQIINNQKESTGANLQVVKQCLKLLSNPNWTVMISHCYRQANRAADWLANHGVSQNLHVNYPSYLPPGLAAVVREDNVGVAFPRLIKT
ncbi:hypothetical protein RDABS01_032808 [Bienertia sinuspersici]